MTLRLRQILIPILLTLALAAAAESPYMTLVEESEKAMNDGRWADADSLLSTALRSEPANPGNILLMSNLGLIRYSLGQDSAALVILSQAHQMAPKAVTILSNRAKVLTSMGRLAEAETDYDTILGLDSLVAQPRMLRGMLRLQRGDSEAVADDLAFMERHFHATYETDLLGALLYSGLEKWQEAIPHYNRLLEKNKEPDFYGGRALCYIHTGALQDASDDINSAISLDPNDGLLYLYRALLYKMRFRPQEAEEDAKKAVELGVNPQTVRQMLML